LEGQGNVAFPEKITKSVAHGGRQGRLFISWSLVRFPRNRLYGVIF
jgi:hypothetical protein